MLEEPLRLFGAWSRGALSEMMWERERECDFASWDRGWTPTSCETWANRFPLCLSISRWVKPGSKNVNSMYLLQLLWGPDPWAQQEVLCKSRCVLENWASIDVLKFRGNLEISLHRAHFITARQPGGQPLFQESTCLSASICKIPLHFSTAH